MTEAMGGSVEGPIKCAKPTAVRDADRYNVVLRGWK
jgi:hypothetical protein